MDHDTNEANETDEARARRWTKSYGAPRPDCETCRGSGIALVRSWGSDVQEPCECREGLRRPTLTRLGAVAPIDPIAERATSLRLVSLEHGEPIPVASAIANAMMDMRGLR